MTLGQKAEGRERVSIREHLQEGRLLAVGRPRAMTKCKDMVVMGQQRLLGKEGT